MHHVCKIALFKLQQVGCQLRKGPQTNNCLVFIVCDLPPALSTVLLFPWAEMWDCFCFCDNQLEGYRGPIIVDTLISSYQFVCVRIMHKRES